MKDKPEAVRARNAGRNEQLEQAGLKQVSVWVPAGKQNIIRDVAKSLRLEDGVLMPSDRVEAA